MSPMMAPFWLESSLKALAVASLLVFAASCQSMPWKGIAGSSQPAESDLWQPGATAIRIYPSSQLAIHDGQWYLEAFVELLDEMGDSTKGGGALQFELFRGISRDSDAAGLRLYVWNVRLHTLADQQRHYDTTLRTYQFRLKMDPLPDDFDDVVLKVMYDNETSGRMDARARLPVRIGS